MKILEQVFGIIKKSLPIKHFSADVLDERREKLEPICQSGFALPQFGASARSMVLRAEQSGMANI